MRIGIDARVLQQCRRGQGQYVYYLVKGLLGIDGDNEYTLFYNGRIRQPFVFDKDIHALRQVWCGIPGSLLAATWSGLSFPPVEYLTGGIDVFHNTINFNFTHYTPIPTRAKMVATFHGMADPSTIWVAYDEKRINRWFEIMARSAHAIIAVSEMAKEDLLRRISIDKKRILVIYLGVDEVFRPIEESVVIENTIAKLGIPGRGYLLYVGSAEKNKNIRKLLEAFRILLQDNRFRDLHLVLAGEIDHNYLALTEEVGRSDIRGKVVFTGHIDQDELVYLYNGAAVFVLPTLKEWFGMPVTEAMACGVPSVVSKNTGALEVVGDAAVIFDPEDCEEMAHRIRTVLEDDILRSSLREKGLRQTRGLSWKKTARQTLAVYEEIYHRGK